MNRKLCMFLCVVKLCTSDWVSEWMSPIQEQLDEGSLAPKALVASAPVTLKQLEDNFENEKMAPINEDQTETAIFSSRKNEQSTVGLKHKVENALEIAKSLADSLKIQILELSSKETKLKDAIANGRSGISTVTVSTMGQSARSYIIREGTWTLCTGIIQSPSAPSSNSFNGLFSMPRCIGQEVPTAVDPCVFNSIIKYETIPTQRRMVYSEDDFLCLKTTFNETVEQYRSVPRRLINDTCINGQIRSLEDNLIQCGMRVISEYIFYPHRSQVSQSTLPLEYCTEADGSCKLMVAWHVSNETIENFEFLKNERSFKKFFMRTNFNSRLSM